MSLAHRWARRSTPLTAAGRAADAGRADAGRADAGRADAGRADVGRATAGRADVGRAVAGRADAGRVAAAASFGLATCVTEVGRACARERSCSSQGSRTAAAPAEGIRCCPPSLAHVLATMATSIGLCVYTSACTEANSSTKYFQHLVIIHRQQETGSQNAQAGRAQRGEFQSQTMQSHYR